MFQLCQFFDRTVRAQMFSQNTSSLVNKRNGAEYQQIRLVYKYFSDCSQIPVIRVSLMIGRTLGVGRSTSVHLTYFLTNGMRVQKACWTILKIICFSRKDSEGIILSYIEIKCVFLEHEGWTYSKDQTHLH